MRIQISASNLLCLQEDNENENYISRLLTHDETWIYHYNLVFMAHSEVWETQLRKLKRKASAGIVMASVWCDSHGMIKKDYFEHENTVTGNTSV